MKLPIVRLTSGLGLVVAAIAAGVMARSLWIIAPLSVIFSIAYVLGKWPAWRVLIEQSTIAKIASQIAATALVQTIMVSVLYLLGRAAAVFGRTSNHAFSNWDVYYSLAVAVFAFASASWVISRERLSATSNLGNAAAIDNDDDPTNPTARVMSDEIRLLAKPVTVQSFFSSPHYSHTDEHNPEKASANAAGSEAKISAAEAQLGIKLPEALRAIYRHQNGGSINDLCVPKPGIAVPKLFDDIITPFSGYNDLAPTESLRTLHESVTNYADPDNPDEADMFPQGCEKMIVLAQWYRHTLFLDYSESDLPSVGFVDFDIDSEDWQAACVRWHSFEAFFKALRHFEAL